jgi:predicted glycoside hydrolase/deacetylase ChbG (UPF0249 family)
MNDRKHLIVNADDFGLSPGVNQGVIHAHVDGIVTSASLMALAPAALEAARYAKRRPTLSLGLHVDLGEWSFANGEWVPLYQVADLGNASDVRDEVLRQLGDFRALVGRDPTHLDTHQHVHLREPAREVLASIASQMGVPLRHLNDRVRYCGDFYGQTEKGRPLPGAISVGGLIETLMKLPRGFTELACHPAQTIDFDTMYKVEREVELRTLCDSRVRDAIAAFDITLCSFHGTPRRFLGADK